MSRFRSSPPPQARIGPGKGKGGDRASLCGQIEQPPAMQSFDRSDEVGDIDAGSAKERSQFREGMIDELTFFRWQVIRANGCENAQLPGPAKYLGRDIRAPRGIAHILR
jgi:hypothetical protein